MIIIVKIFLAHLIGDFLLQPHTCVKSKEEKKLRSRWLYLHAAIHGLLAQIVIWDSAFWKWALLIAFVHLAIDAAKVWYQTEETKRAWFLFDQFLHLVSIYVIGSWFAGTAIVPGTLLTENNLILLTFVLLLTTPASIAIKILISKWTPHTDDNDTASLESAGMYIGILERLFVFGFILTNHWEAVGFLIAAKSVFRFGDLKESKDRKLTEYVLIGTMISFGFAILIGIIYLKLASGQSQ